MRLKFYIFASLLIVVFAVWFPVFTYGYNGSLKVYFLNVGQGDASFIETPEHIQVLIDGGPDSSVLSELSSVMPFYDRKIDILILSHPQKDHIFGLVEVLKRYEVGNVVFTSIEYKNSAYDEFKKIVEEKNINKIEARAGTQIKIGQYAFLDILYPFEDMSGKLVGNPNDVSIAVKLNFLGKEFFFAGDAELKEEVELVNSGEDVDIDVLKVSHHGSKTSSSELFLEKTTPEIAVISVGKNNSYGHPHQEVLERFENIKTLRTDINGRIQVTTDGLSLNYQTKIR